MEVWHALTHQVGHLQFSRLPRRNSHPKWLKRQSCRPEKLWYARVFVISILEGLKLFKNYWSGLCLNQLDPVHCGLAPELDIGSVIASSLAISSWTVAEIGLAAQA
eukprot:s1858_g8.t1